MEAALIPKPVVLLILDGWGIAPPTPGNALSQSQITNFTKFWAAYPHTQLQASAEAVGLPQGAAGNSEVGHLNIGAGRIVYQELPRINMSIADGGFMANRSFLSAAEYVHAHNSSLHLIGLLGPGKVHSSIEHLFALLWFCKEHAISSVYIHAFTDGRDAPPTSGVYYIQQLIEKLKYFGIGKIATITGRYYGMDRDNRWDRTRQAYEAIVEGKGVYATSPVDAVTSAYESQRTDEFILPTVLLEESGQPVATIKDNDAVIFFNFRADRARQLTKALLLPDFERMKITQQEFDPYLDKYKMRERQKEETVTTFIRQRVVSNLFFVSMTQYEKGLQTVVAYPPEEVRMPLARVLSEYGKRQLHIAETEKYAHVTYFLNGGREISFPLEDRFVIQSAKVATYDLKPDMSAYEITELFFEKLELKVYDFIVLNFANPDMVAHTGVLGAAIQAVEVVDECMGAIVKSVQTVGGACIVTSDHGNVEEMLNPHTGDIDTEHNINPVPFIAVLPHFLLGTKRMLPMGVLADIAPTVLALMGISKPVEMTGKNLLA